MKRFFAALAAIFVLAFWAFGQAETITNAGVIEMVKAGLSPEIVLRKINQGAARFDVSTSALIELKKAQVPDEIIAAMMDRAETAGPDTSTAGTPAFSESGAAPDAFASSSASELSKKDMLARAKTIAFVKSTIHPSRQALEKELMKRPDFRETKLTIMRYKEQADLYVEIGYVSLSWITHRYVYRIYDRKSGTVLAAGETTSWGSLAENLARHIGKSLKATLAG